MIGDSHKKKTPKGAFLASRRLNIVNDPHLREDHS